MKITTDQNNEFRPIKMEILLETREEVAVFKALGNCKESIAEKLSQVTTVSQSLTAGILSQFYHRLQEANQ